MMRLTTMPPMREVLQHHAFVAELLDLLQALDHVLNCSDRAVFPVAVEDVLRLAAELRAHAPRRLEQLTFVPADHERRHQRAAERGRVAARALTRLVERPPALTDLVERGE